MADNTTNLLLPYILASQAQKHVTHNDALRLLDGLVQLSVLDRDLTAPPGSPAEGARYIVAAGATGLWSGWSSDIALWSDGAWLRLPARIGWLVWVEDEGLLLVYDGAGWIGASSTVLSGSTALRVTTGGTADAITLTTGAALGAIPTGLSLRFRASAANTGATTINVDGTGAVACKTIRDAVLPAGYIRTDADTEIMYDGTIWIAERQSERASNANGWYVRHSDGTQICQIKPVIKPASDATTGVKSYAWTYPAEFANGSAGSISTVHILQNNNPDQRFAVSVGSANATGCTLFYNEPVGIASDIKTMATATGRWY